VLAVILLSGLVWYGLTIDKSDFSHISTPYQSKKQKKDRIKELLMEVFDPDNTETWYSKNEISKMKINSDKSPWEKINGQPFSKIFMGAYSNYVSPYFIRAKNATGRYIELYYYWDEDIYACESCGTIIDDLNAEQQCLNLKGDPRDPVWSGQRKFKISGELDEDYYVYQTWTCESRGCKTTLLLGGNGVKFIDCYE
jgi:hypothetical protein